MKSINLICSLVMVIGMSISGLARADLHHSHMAGVTRTEIHHDHVGGFTRIDHRHSHVGVDFFFGAPFYYPYYYPYPYYPPVVAVPAEPPVYIEQGNADDYYWYHCDNPEGYYPYIKNCPDGWKRVTPTPPPQP